MALKDINATAKVLYEKLNPNNARSLTGFCRKGWG